MGNDIIGRLLAWERHEGDPTWWAWVSWIHHASGRHHHKVAQVRADTLRPLEPPHAYTHVPRRTLTRDGRIHTTQPQPPP